MTATIKKNQSDENKLLVSDNWRRMLGAGYGIYQTKLIGRIKVKNHEAFSHPVFQSSMDEIFGVYKATQSSITTTVSSEISVHKIVGWYFAMYKGLRVPVFPTLFIDPRDHATVSGGSYFDLALPAFSPQIAYEALSLVITTANLLFSDQKSCSDIIREASAQVTDLRSRIVSIAPKGINTTHLLRAADTLKIDVFRIIDDVFRFGQGENSILLKSTLSDEASHLGVRIAGDKWNTSQYLKGLGLPVPEQRRVNTIADADKAAQEIGFPVVVKPVNQEQGRGVNAGIHDSIVLYEAFEAARKYSKSVLVEKHIYGDEFRFTVYNDNVIKIIRRRPGGVVGDGKSTIADLVERVAGSNEVRIRSVDPTYRPVSLDAEALSILADQHLAPESIPTEGKFVPMRRRANILAGGTQLFVDMSLVHPDNLELAIRATRCLRLDLAGVDLIFPDVECSWLQTGGTIIEVNSMPQIGMEFTPKIYEDLLSTMLPTNGRIEVHLVLQMNSKARLQDENIFQLAQNLGCKAISCRDGLWIDRRRVSREFNSGYEAAQALLSDTTVNSIAIVMTPDELLRTGLPTGELESVSQIFTHASSKAYIGLLPECRRLFQPHLKKKNE